MHRTRRVALPIFSVLVGIGCGQNATVRPNADASPDKAPGTDALATVSSDSASLPDAIPSQADAFANRAPDAVAPRPEGGAGLQSDPGTPAQPDGGGVSPGDGNGARADAQGNASESDGAVGLDTNLTSLGRDGGTPGTASRIILVDGTSDTFAAYDNNGQQVHDYHALLTAVPSWDGKPWISLGGNMAHWTTSSELVTSVYSTRSPTGLSQPVRPSTVLVAGDQTSGVSRILLASMAGSTLATLDATVGDAFALSPRERHLVGGASVVRVSDQTVLYRAAGGDGGVAFSPDDKHLIGAWNAQIPFELVDLDSGHVTQPDMTALPFPFGTDRQHVFVKAALDTGAVITVDFGYGTTLTRQLWWVDWQGNMMPFDASRPQYALEDFVRFDPMGSKVLWTRSTGATSPSFPLGYFSFDLGSKQVQAWKDVGQAQGIDSTDCFDSQTTTFYGVAASALMACDCATGDCHTLAGLPTISWEWTPALVVSPDRSIIAVHYYWTVNSREPTSGIDTQIFRSTGETLAVTPCGSIEFDQNSTLAMTLNVLPGMDGTNVVNLTTGKVTALGKAKRSVVAYE
jgi:hypothetical protein